MKFMHRTLLRVLFVCLFFQVHCISTEFTPRKHGGEKGVPFRIQVDTFKQTENGEYTDHLHSASCQIKVFKVMVENRYLISLSEALIKMGDIFMLLLDF